MRSGFFSNPLGKFAAVAIVLIIGVVSAHWIVSASPRESNRTRHLAGYSIIHPDGWSPDMRHGSGKPGNGISPTRDLITMSPDRYVGVTPTIYVKRLAGGIDSTILRANGWTDGTFQNQPAMVCTAKVKHSTIRVALFQRYGQWFEVGEELPFAAQIHADEWWSFLETFRYPDGKIDPEMDRPVPTTTESSTQPADDPLTRPIDF